MEHITIKYIHRHKIYYVEAPGGVKPAGLSLGFFGGIVLGPHGGRIIGCLYGDDGWRDIMQRLPCCEVGLRQKSFIVVSCWRYGNMLGWGCEI